jgi:hypothetical protein
MPNKNIARCVAVLACLGMLALSAPGLSSASKAKGTVSLAQLIKQPALIVSTFVAQLDPAAKAPALSGGRVRPTSDTPIPTPGKGD